LRLIDFHPSSYVVMPTAGPFCVGWALNYKFLFYSILYL